MPVSISSNISILYANGKFDTWKRHGTEHKHRTIVVNVARFVQRMQKSLKIHISKETIWLFLLKGRWYKVMFVLNLQKKLPGIFLLISPILPITARSLLSDHCAWQASGSSLRWKTCWKVPTYLLLFNFEISNEMMANSLKISINFSFQVKCRLNITVEALWDTQITYRTTSFIAISSFSATSRLVRPFKTKYCVIVRSLV